MKKSFIFLLIFDIILTISVICLYNYVIQTNKNNLQSMLSGFEWNSESSARISELEDKVEELENIIKNNEK